MTAYFMGIDVGTQGVRVVLTDQAGEVIGSEASGFPLTAQSREEQSPAHWWTSCLNCLDALMASLSSEVDRSAIRAVSVTSTSGTVIPLDEQNEPLHDALMYSDPRSVAEGKQCKEVAERFYPQGYTGFNASSGLSKMVWFVHHFPEKADKIKTWIHATDFIIGKLSGTYTVTDYTNAFKSGFDVNLGVWPEYVHTQLPLKKEWLQQVVPSGTVIGQLRSEWSERLGIPAMDVVAGMTDGCASQVASGAVKPGDWNTTIGTTLVIKGVTVQEIKDPQGRLYSHRHPQGYWMPGGASNTGADWISTDFGKDLADLNQAASQLIPTAYIAYPLKQAGERFPFISAEARGFAPDGLSQEELFTANMEGVAYLERYAYDLIETLSGERAETIFTAGGASNSDTWLTIRANVLNRPVAKCSEVTGAVGAAIVAASGTYYDTLMAAGEAMTHIEKVVYPDPLLTSQYAQGYARFIQELQDRHYLDSAVLS